MFGSWLRVGLRLLFSRLIEEFIICRSVFGIVDFFVIIYVFYFIVGLFDINCLVGDIVLIVIV